MPRALLFLLAISLLACLLVFSNGEPRKEDLEAPLPPSEAIEMESTGDGVLFPPKVERVSIPVLHEVDSTGAAKQPSQAPLESTLASGRVLDAFGLPVPNVRVQLEVRIEGGSLFPEFLWKPLDKLRTESAADGSFILRGANESGIYRMTAVHNTIITTYQTIHLGDEDVEIIVSKSWAIGGRVLLDENLTKYSFLISVRPETNEANSNATHETLLNHRNGWKIENLPEGYYLLELTRRGFPTPLYSRKLVLGPEGGRERQPNIDLRGVVKEFTLTVMDGSGDTPTNCWASTLDRVPLGTEVSGTLSILTTASSLDIEVGAKGCRNAVLRNVRSDTTVHLSAGIPVQIFLEAPGTPDGWHWYCELVPVNSDVSLPPSSFDQVIIENTNGEITGIPRPGHYQLQMYLCTGTNVFHIPKAISRDLHLPIWNIIDTEDVQAFRHAMTSRQIKEAVEDLRSDRPFPRGSRHVH